MKNLLLTLIVVVAAAVLAGCGDDDGDGAGEPAPAPPAFGYSGASGPSNWGSLDPAYEACSAGRSQSPIELRGGQPADLPGIDGRC